MGRDPQYDVLFEPVKIGPVTAKNRFYQVPHCNGMGRSYPSSMAEMRRIKAEGGWAVVTTEEVEIHPSGDHSPWMGGRLWEDRDIPVLARMCDAAHRHGALAGCELNHAGVMAANRYSRDVPLAPSHTPIALPDPVQARAMDLTDIRLLRQWHREAALRAKQAGFDIIYVYAGHQLSTISHFLSPYRNRRSDAYGGSLENRARLLREVLEDTRDAVGDTCAVAIRLSVDELMGADGISSDGEGRELVEMLAEETDLWDVNISGWENDSATSRFKASGYQEEYIGWVKSVTSKPVVGVGRYTSPNAMVSLVKKGVLDFIGAARPSIADPFLPNKISEGRIEDIRECIGCNICVSGDNTFVPIRCTQNPTMGEEWRKGWHPEKIAPAPAKESVLIVGAGPSGLEAARALGQRGYAVTLADRATELGGRVQAERRLPGLAEWGRVVDYRTWQIGQMNNVEVFLDSEMNVQTVQEFGADHVVLSTGSKWTRDGIGRENPRGIGATSNVQIMTPDDIMAGKRPGRTVVIFDDDHFYIGGLIAEVLCRDGCDVTLVTPAAHVSEWTYETLEQHRIQARLMKMGVKVFLSHNVTHIGTDTVTIACGYTDSETTLRANATVLITMRSPNDALYHDLSDVALPSLARIGDCLAPSTIAAAVYAGHRYARELGETDLPNVPFRRELPALAPLD
ncbi:MAG: FAD-dependent oxidoreductase [Tateyamaria sp.]|uniref:oxidoreductase n=1 Tax=Tateyamaria sp. TaxID=1929288 RepID=UPI003288F770